MDEISESITPFPHRAGNLFQIHYAVFWSDQDTKTSEKYDSLCYEKSPTSIYQLQRSRTTLTGWCM
ncbi:hypothetical protein NC653_004453 [Populus alba x Populus x berolinensis]|uniref:Uncharacterized protein n=1 Tax=Populus alba x Populus x berolinensis TaxID=444605 RepID=A0AAD6RUU4_9ROSI|nr:hypothetical protein NC653_004453 [Populus alba x Populus x berolinensis]